MKKIFLLFILILNMFLPCFAQGEFIKSAIGIVEGVETVDADKSSQDGQMKQIVKVKIISGEYKGERVIINNVLTNNPMFDIFLVLKDKVVLHVDELDDGVEFFISDRYRTPTILFFGGLFCLLLLVVGRKKGLFSLVSIVVTVGLIFWVLTPMILNGFNPVLATVLVCMISTLLAIYLVGGFNYKSTSAILGCIISLIFAGIMSWIAIVAANLTGFSQEETLYLFSAHPDLNFVGILASAVIIGALGALMDVGMSIASTINELFEIDEEMSVKNLFASGMNVGRDIIGTMANTLLLVYLGGALPLVLLSQNLDLQKFFNLNQVATEILSALVGSISLVVCVPATALIAAFLIKTGKKEDIVLK